MTIALHFSASNVDDLENNYLYNCMLGIAALQPQDHFIFIFDKAIEGLNIFCGNITPVVSGPVIRNRLLQHYFYNLKIPRLLKKYNVDLLISSEVCSIFATTPQLLIIPDLSFIKRSEIWSTADRRYLKKFTGKFLLKAKMVGIFHAQMKSSLHLQYKTDPEKTFLLPMRIDESFHAYPIEATDLLKYEKTAGNEFFLFIADKVTAMGIVTVLKAFSLFKKWQKSDMKIVILSHQKNAAAIILDFRNYKHRDDVIFVEDSNLSSKAILLASAYAVIDLPCIEVSRTLGLQVLASEVPLITTNTEFYRSLYGDSALYCSLEAKEISEKMMFLYKDETARNSFIISGRKISDNHRPRSAEESLQQLIQRSIEA